ncbi:MAG TPA: pyridoxamine 5'-phosphate oxidase family protein [Thermoleophilaceae bacterium]|nr:pyridoxamine 5'-phosphate oxidase family protein [Thermoleophilaceae bacterium]
MSGRPVPSRPGIDPGYGIGRGGSAPGELLPWERVEQWLEAARNYWVSTTRPDGRPHAKPVWGLWLDGRVLFSTDPNSVTGRNIAAGSPVQIHLESGDEVAILDGDLEWPDDPDLLARAVDAYEKKYGIRFDPAPGETPFMALRPGKILSWEEADYPETATRWDVYPEPPTSRNAS